MNKQELEIDVKDGFSTSELSKKYNKSKTTVRYWLNKFNLKTNPSSIHEELDWNRWQQLYDSGLSWSEIKGYTIDSVSWALKHGKIKTRTKSDAQKLSWKNGKIKPETYRTEKHRKKMAKFGGYRENAGRCKHINFIKKDGTKVHLQGTWELKFAEFLEIKNIIWERNKVGYRYNYEGKDRNYFPDFYLKDFNLFTEVKGYETNKDRAKWSQFPFKLSILKKKEIQDLDSWYKNLQKE